MTQTHFGFRTVELHNKQPLVNSVFHNVAERYDLMNDVMSAGLHRLWKKALVNRLPLYGKGRNLKVLDVAGGTGDIAFRIHRAMQGRADITILDINASMLQVGQDRAEKSGLDDIHFIEADAQNLPFEDRSYDVYTIAFGIRNVPDINKALQEAYRVLKPGGQCLVLEFAPVTMPVLKQLYDTYSFKILPQMGRRIANDEDSYRYLAESIRRFPTPPSFKAMLDNAGFEQCSYQSYTGGIAILYEGFRL
jgi:demethylmenaquinone methyltransferase/2-methoxy-6-polyprenyl-1,4-benzoquinol methylase